MTRECGHGPLLNNYIKITGIKLTVSEPEGCYISISIKAYLSKEARDFEKMKEYIIKNNLIPIAKNFAQAEYMNLHWNKPNILSIGEATLTEPVRMMDWACKSEIDIYSMAYLFLVERRTALGFKNANSNNIIENHLETDEEFKKRVVNPFIDKFNSIT